MIAQADSKRTRADTRRAMVMSVILSLQALAAVFFVVDVVHDLTWVGFNPHSMFEAVVALALVIGTAFGALQLRHILQRIRRAEAAASIASGAFMDLIEASFRDWGLTPAEAEVALFSLKGLDVDEIAALRGAAQGTVRAQLAKVYSKAGVTSRGQLTSLFIEELLMMPLIGTAPVARDS